MKMRKGFTLVELLMVIVIIGILAGTMLLSTGASTASAKASNVVSELRNLKAASIMFWADSMDLLASVNSITPLGSVTTACSTYLARYMDNSSKIDTTYLFDIQVVGGSVHWFLGMDVSNMSKAVKDKLKGGFSLVDLLAGTSSLTDRYSGGSTIWMVAR